jgi:hypothetical protein
VLAAYLRGAALPRTLAVGQIPPGMVTSNSPI